MTGLGSGALLPFAAMFENIHAGLESVTAKLAQLRRFL